MESAVLADHIGALAADDLAAAVRQKAVIAGIVVVVDVTAAVSDLRAAADAFVPPVVHQRGAAAGSFTVLCAVCHRPETIFECVIGNRDIVRTSAVVFRVQITFIGGVQPNEFSHFILPVSCMI